MIYYNYETKFNLENETKVSEWITNAINSEGYELEEISYIFCDDDYLLEKNIKYLNHDTLTDIISFDYTIGKQISGDIFISIERIKENCNEFNTEFIDELHRVIIHGVLHFCNFKDKTKEEKQAMRTKEDYYLSLRKI